MTYQPATDSTIPSTGKKRKRSETENGEAAEPPASAPVTPTTPATEEGRSVNH